MHRSARQVGRGVVGAVSLATTMASACLRVPPPAVAQIAASASLPAAGAAVTIVGLGPADDVDGKPYLGKTCRVESIEENIEARGFARAYLTCDGQQVLFTQVRLREVTQIATQRRLPAGLSVQIAGIGEGDVYYDDRERFVGSRCVTISLRRSQALYYQGTLNCYGVPYQFAYVALAASR